METRVFVKQNLHFECVIYILRFGPHMSVLCNWGTYYYCAKTRVVIRNYAIRS